MSAFAKLPNRCSRLFAQGWPWRGGRIIGSRRKRKELEAALVMAEVKLACLLVDHRGDPEMQRLLTRQRDSVLTLRRRLAGNVSDGLVTTLRRWPSPGVAIGRLRRALGAAAARPI